MKIRTKLFGSFIIVAAIGILLGVLGYYSNKRLTALSGDILGIFKRSSSISSILNAHYTWRHGLSEAVYADISFTGSLNPRACALGRWLESNEAKEITHPEVILLLQKVIEPHDFIHIKAREIIDNLNSMNTDEAKRIFRMEILPKTSEVIADLEEMEALQVQLVNDKNQEILELGLRFELIIIAVVITAVIASILLALLITSNIVSPILPLAAFMEKASTTGDIVLNETDKKNVGRFTRRDDEIGATIRSFAHFLEKIREMVTNIRKKADTLYDIGSSLTSNMTETAAAINEITANIQSTKGRTMNQSASVSETHATMEQVVANINKLDGLVEQQSDNVSKASSAIEQMAANIRSVSSTLANNAANVHTLREASEVGRGGLQEVATDIQEISRESEGLLEINSVMENIASQTNLLSMNAAIEAAHAGEAGKGFAVVADEIRKLAESSSEQSKTIGTVLKKIKGSIDKITQSTENVLTKFEAIDSSVKVVSAQEEQIRGAMEEQGEGSKQIVQGVLQVNDITRQVRSSSQEMLEGSREVIQESTNLEKATQEITAGMNEMASGADEINVAIHHVNELSGQNREGIDALLHEVSRFKVE